MHTIARGGLRAALLPLLAALLAGCRGEFVPFHLDPIYNPPGQALTPGTQPALPEPATAYPAWPDGAGWTSASGGRLLAGQWAGNGPQAAGALQRTRLPGWVHSSAVRGSDGLWRMLSNDMLLAVDGSGRLREVVDLELLPRNQSPLLASPDAAQLYLETAGCGCAALAPDGTVLWRFSDPGDESFDLLGLGAGGLLVGEFHGENGRSGVRALRPDGTPGWSYAGGPDIWLAATAPAPDGTVYAVEAGVDPASWRVVALAAGQVAWSSPLSFQPDRAPLVARDGSIHVAAVDEAYASTEEAQVHIARFAAAGGPALASIATPRYAAAAGGQWQAVLPDGNWLYAADAPARLTAASPAGARVWQVDGIGSVNELLPQPDGGLLVRGSAGETGVAASIGPGGALRWLVAHEPAPQHLTTLSDGGALLGAGDELLNIGPNGGQRFALRLPDVPLALLRTDNTGNCYFVSGRLLLSYDRQLARRWQASLELGDAGPRELLLGPAGEIVVLGGRSFAVYSSQGQLLRQVQLPGLVDYGIGNGLLGADGTLYLAGMHNRQVSAYTLGGTRLWTYTDETAAGLRPVLDAGGRLYLLAFGLSSQQSLVNGAPPDTAALVGLGRNGARRFRLPLPALPAALPRSRGTTALGGPLVDRDGSLLVSLQTGAIVRCAADGSGLQPVPAPPGVTLLAALADGGLLAVEGVNTAQPHANRQDYGDLLRLNADGSIAWRSALGGSGVEQALVDAGGTVYVQAFLASLGAYGLKAIDPTGATRFERLINASTPADRYATVAPASGAGFFIAVDDELQYLGE